METKLLEGKTLALSIREGIQKEIEKLKAQGKEVPALTGLQVGPDPSADWYLGQQKKMADKLGIKFDLVTPDHFPDQHALITQIKKVSADAGVQGVFLAMPLPAGFNADEALLELDPKKDVEGIHPASLGLIVLRKSKLIPPTAYAAFKLIESTGIELRGKTAAIVGQSAIVGRPLQMLLGERRVTTTVCNTGTSARLLEKTVSESDIVVACAGKPGLVRGGWIKPGAVVIDVGTTEVDGKLAGDVEFEEAKKHAGFITPVPGGVGPLTVTMLMQNLMHAYKWQQQ